MEVDTDDYGLSDPRFDEIDDELLCGISSSSSSSASSASSASSSSSSSSIEMEVGPSSSGKDKMEIEEEKSEPKAVMGTGSGMSISLSDEPPSSPDGSVFMFWFDACDGLPFYFLFSLFFKIFFGCSMLKIF